MLARLLSALCLFAAQAAAQQLSLIDAISRTLQHHPRLEVERDQVRIAAAARRQAAGIFDPLAAANVQQARINTPLAGFTRLESDQAGLTAAAQSSNLTSTGASLTRLLRNGVQLSSSFGLSRATDNLTQTAGVNSSQLRFQLVLPLKRGRGYNIVAAEEIASAIETDAATLELNHAAAALIADTASRYWELAAASQSLDVLQQAEQRGQTFLENVRTLVDADRLPRAELQQVNANLAARISNRAAGEQRLVEAAQALALAIGASPEELRQSVAVSDPLPDGETAARPSMVDADISKWLQVALARRADYLAVRKRQGALDTRRAAAADRLRPQLDLHLASGYSGLKEGRRPDGFLLSPFTNVGGLDLTVGIEFSQPLNRNAAYGQLDRAAALVRQNQWTAADLARSISSSILAGIGAYKASIIRVQQARIAVDASISALDGEREKLRLGVGSVVDLLTVEDRLNAQRLNLVEARLNFALLLARLRFGTGTLVAPDRPAQSVPRVIFYRPPWEDPAQ